MKETDIFANQFFREKNSKHRRRVAFITEGRKVAVLWVEKEHRKRGLGLRESLSPPKRI